MAVWAVRREVWNASSLPPQVVRRQLPTDSYDGEHGVLVGLWRASALAPGTKYSNYLHRAQRALHSLSYPLHSYTRTRIQSQLNRTLDDASVQDCLSLA